MWNASHPFNYLFTVALQIYFKNRNKFNCNAYIRKISEEFHHSVIKSKENLWTSAQSSLNWRRLVYEAKWSSW